MSTPPNPEGPPGPSTSMSSFRRRRLAGFVRLVDEVLRDKSECRILDVGGTQAYWRESRDLWQGRPVAVTLLNVEAEPVDDPRFVSVEGDACDLARFESGSFDLVHSNSVIEHVGRWGRMSDMAREVARVGRRYFVQTPAYWFPLEPHFRVPFFHWLPEPVRLKIVMARPCGSFPRAASIDQAMAFLEDSNLLDHARLARLFPDARIERERVGPFTKSYVAIR